MKTVKLIVYGTLLSGERNHHFCRNAVKITPCTVIGTLYDTGCGVMCGNKWFCFSVKNR